MQRGFPFFCRLLLLTLFSFLIIFTYPFDALGPRGAPTFLLLQKSRQKSSPKAFPLWNPPLRSRWRVLRTQFARGNGGTPRSFGAGASALDFWISGACASGLRAAKAKNLAFLTFHARSGAAHGISQKSNENKKAKQSPSIMRACAWDGLKIRTARQRLRKSSAEAPAAKRRGVPPLPRANCGRRPRQRDRRGIPKGEPLWAALLPTFLQKQKSRGPRAA